MYNENISEDFWTYLKKCWKISTKFIHHTYNYINNLKKIMFEGQRKKPTLVYIKFFRKNKIFRIHKCPLWVFWVLGAAQCSANFPFPACLRLEKRSYNLGLFQHLPPSPPLVKKINSPPKQLHIVHWLKNTLTKFDLHTISQWLCVIWIMIKGHKLVVVILSNTAWIWDI